MKQSICFEFNDLLNRPKSLPNTFNDLVEFYRKKKNLAPNSNISFKVNGTDIITDENSFQKCQRKYIGTKVVCEAIINGMNSSGIYTFRDSVEESGLNNSSCFDSLKSDIDSKFDEYSLLVSNLTNSSGINNKFELIMDLCRKFDNKRPEIGPQRTSQSQGNIIHNGFKCNHCGISPIKGYRYQCTVSTCPNSNLCTDCFESNLINEFDPHEFLEIRKIKMDNRPCLQLSQSELTIQKCSELLRYELRIMNKSSSPIKCPISVECDQNSKIKFASVKFDQRASIDGNSQVTVSIILKVKGVKEGRYPVYIIFRDMKNNQIGEQQTFTINITSSNNASQNKNQSIPNASTLNKEKVNISNSKKDNPGLNAHYPNASNERHQYDQNIIHQSKRSGLQIETGQQNDTHPLGIQYTNENNRQSSGQNNNQQYNDQNKIQQPLTDVIFDNSIPTYLSVSNNTGSNNNGGNNQNVCSYLKKDSNNPGGHIIRNRVEDDEEEEEESNEFAAFSDTIPKERNPYPNQNINKQASHHMNNYNQGRFYNPEPGKYNINSNNRDFSYANSFEDQLEEDINYEIDSKKKKLRDALKKEGVKGWVSDQLLETSIQNYSDIRSQILYVKSQLR